MPGLTTPEREAPTVPPLSVLGPPPARRRPSSVTQLGNYRILRRIGAGGMGEVHAAYDETLERTVALKLIHGELEDPRARARLRREAIAMAQLSHPNVVTVYEVDEIDGLLFIAMELVDGQTLRDWCAARRRSWSDIVTAVRHAGEGLMAAHERGLLHRDFKPDNVMVDVRGRVRVMDFGLVSTPSATPMPWAGHAVDTGVVTGDDPTTHRSVAGTPAYMSPEQLAGDPLDARSDQFSLCVTLYELLFGRRPFEGRTHAALLLAIRAGAIAAPPARPSAPAAVRRAIERGLAAKPEDRFASVEVLLTTLRRAQQGPTRRRRALGLGVVASIAAVVAGQPWAASGEGPRCDEVSAPLDEDWSEARAKALTHSFEATGLPSAPGVASRVIASLDAYAASWADLRTASCRAALVDQISTEDFADRQLRCLARRRTHLQRLIARLERADSTTVRNAQAAVDALPRVAACDDPVWLAAQVKPPEDPEIAEAVERLEGEVATARAERISGAPESSRARLSSVLVTAQQLEFPPAIAEVRYELGVTERSLYHPREATTYLREAFFTAGAHGDDWLAYRAAIALVNVAGELEARYEAALTWADHGMMLGARLGAQRSLEHASLLHERGAIANRQARFDDARALLGDGVVVVEEAGGPEHPDLCPLLNSMAFSLNELGDHERARAQLERALRIASSHYGDQHLSVANLHQTMGTTLMALRRTAPAIEHLHLALETRRRVLGPDNPATATTLMNLGAALTEVGDLEGARASLHEALEILERQPELHPDVAYVHNSLGQLEFQRRNLAAAEEHGRRALERWTEQYGPEHPQLAYALSVVGLALVEQGQREQGRTRLRRALELRRAVFDEDHPLVQNLHALLRYDPGRRPDER